MAINQGIDLNNSIAGGFDVSSTNVYHPSGIKMTKQELDTLECPRCSKFLREPVQLITCGCRFCTVCIDSMLANESSSLKCPVDLTDFTKKHVRKDKGCVKEINLLQVDCVLKCGWKGLLVEVEEHVRTHCPNAQIVCELGCGQVYPRSEKEKHSIQCGKQSIACDFCKTTVTKDELTIHQQSVCQEYPVTCDFCHLKALKRKDLQQHLEDVCEQYEMDCPVQHFSGCQFKAKKKLMEKHVQQHTVLMFEKFGLLWERMDKIEAEKEELLKVIEKKDEVIQLQTKQLVEKDDMLTKLDDRLRSLEMTVRHGHELPDIVETDRACSRKIKSKGTAVVRSSGQRIAIDGDSSILSRQVANVAESSETHTNQIQQLNQNVQMLQESVTQQTIVVDELRLRQDILDVRTTNGTFVWKIPDIRRRYREAIDRRTVSIYSPPYFTSPQGYRICTRVYLNGDGIGKGTHISVFFVLMKSEHDNLLAWPFKQSVRFTLINQVNQSASITEAFAPDLTSPSFQQPESEMNIASGFPKFAKQSVLQDENFTKGNTIYIKAQVDMNGLGTY